MAKTQIEMHADQLEFLFSKDPGTVSVTLYELRRKHGLAFHSLPVLIHLTEQEPVSRAVANQTRELLAEFQEAIKKNAIVEEQLRGFDGLVAQTLSAQSESERAVASAELGNRWWRYPVSVWALRRASKETSALVREVASRILAMVIERHHTIEAQSFERLSFANHSTDSSHSQNQQPANLNARDSKRNQILTPNDEYSPIQSALDSLRKPKSRRGFQGAPAIRDSYSLAYSDPDSDDSVDDLIEQIKESNAGRSLHAMTCVAQLGQNGKSAIPELCEQLRSREVKRRVWAAYALGSLGQTASSALPSLSLAFWDEDKRVRDAVRAAQSKIQT